MGYLQKYLPIGLSLSSKELRNYLLSTVLTVGAMSTLSLLRELFLPPLLWLYLSVLIMAIYLLGISIHLYNKLNISTKELSNAKSIINSLQEPAKTLDESIHGMAAIHDAQQNKINELLTQQKKIAQLIDDDIRLMNGRFHFLSSLEPHLQTPQTIAEIKYLSSQMQNYIRFSEILVKSLE